MSQCSDAEIERAEARVVAERDAGLRRIQAVLAGQGADACVDCGEPIDPARRLALPSACRCASCQGELERKVRK